MSHFFENTGLLSGFDPQSKHVTLSYVLRTLMAAYARVNNRIIGNDIVFFATVPSPANGQTTVCRFKLPKGATSVMLWSPGYKLTDKDGTDQLASDNKVVSETENDSVLPRFHKEASSIEQTEGIYAVHVDKAAGEHYFFIVYYKVNGVANNAYVSFFVENISDTDKSTHLKHVADYVRHFASGNLNVGEAFSVYDVGQDGIPIAKDRLVNKPNRTPTLSDRSTWMPCLAPIVNKTERRSRRGGQAEISYETAYPDDLCQVADCLLKYINAIHASGLLTLPRMSSATNDWLLHVRDTADDIDPFAIDKRSTLITIATHVSKNGRQLDRIVIRDSCIAKLIFGTDGQWLLPMLQGGARFKSPGNGSILRYICGRCTDDSKIRQICSQLATEVDGVYNDVLGLSTQRIEDIMLTNANLVRSTAEVGLSYRKLTDVDVASAYYANFADFFRMLANLRQSEDDYFINVLQKPLSFTGKRKGADGKQDSTKLMAVIGVDKVNKVIRDRETDRILMIDKVDGGVFYELRKQLITDENRGILCPFSREVAEVNNMINLFPTIDYLTPVTLNKTSGQQVSLSGLNKHVPLSIKIDSAGVIYPVRAKPFKEEPSMLSRLPDLKQQTMDYLISKRFLDRLQANVTSAPEYRLACSLAHSLANGNFVSIFDLLPYTTNVEREVWACSFCLREGREALGECDCIETRVPTLYTNVVVNCSKPFTACRKRLLMPLHFVNYMKTKETEFTPLDRINGFLLSADWRKSTYLQQLALAASVLHANTKPTASDLSDAPAPMTEAIWINFGMPLTMVHENGDLLVRTMQPCLSEQAVCTLMLLATKKWSFVIGNVPRDVTSFNSARDQFTRRPFANGGGEVSASVDTFNGRAPSPSRPFLPAMGGIVVTSRRTLLDELRLAIASAESGSLTKKKNVRPLIMRALAACGERESLFNLPLTRKEDHHVSLSEFLYRVHVQLPKSVVVDKHVYHRAQYETDCVDAYLDAL